MGDRWKLFNGTDPNDPPDPQIIIPIQRTTNIIMMIRFYKVKLYSENLVILKREILFLSRARKNSSLKCSATLAPK